MVRLLLSFGADTNLQDKQGTTALMFASERGHTHIARLLLERSRCDLTLTDKVMLPKTNNLFSFKRILKPFACLKCEMWVVSSVVLLVYGHRTKVHWTQNPVKKKRAGSIPIKSNVSSCDDNSLFLVKPRYIC